MKSVRIFMIAGICSASVGFIGIIFLHVTTGSWTKSVLQNHVTEIRKHEDSSFTKDDMEDAVIGAVVARANKIQSTMIPGFLMLAGCCLILISNKSNLVSKE